ncbi:MAG: hypothetical protein HQK96_03975 [Nitrospirae bacterium]|nr:hypothetical protein [Nitrospirota bacterium]
MEQAALVAAMAAAEPALHFVTNACGASSLYAYADADDASLPITQDYRL